VELRVVTDRTQVSHSHAARCRMTITQPCWHLKTC
jgi:hypothetical protein